MGLSSDASLVGQLLSETSFFGLISCCRSIELMPYWFCRNRMEIDGNEGFTEAYLRQQEMRDQRAYSKHISSSNHGEHNLFKKCRDRCDFILS